MRHIILNMDEEEKKDLESGIGFRISRSVGVTRSSEITREKDSIYSSLYGGTVSDQDEVDSLRNFTCECGKTSGKYQLGTICPHCGKEVTFHDEEIKKMGWMELQHGYQVINPRVYPLLETIFKAKKLDEMLRFERKLDKHGMMKEAVIDPKNPFANIGLMEFYNNFDAILDQAGDKKKILEIQFIKEIRDKIFTSHIPVISLLLRPVVLINNTTFNYDPLNKFYAEMVSYVEYINKNQDNESTYANLSILYELQRKWLDLDDEIRKQKLNGKKRIIRGNILGSRIDFSARHILIPNTKTTKIDSIVLPYLTFCEFYKFHIMNIYKKLYNVTIHELEDRWYTLIRTQDPSIMKIIDILIHRTKGGLQIYNNRNPTLSYGSTMCLELIGINEDIHNLTMQLVPLIEPAMNADHDGDALNSAPILFGEFSEKFKRMYSPERMVVSMNTGRYNQKIGLLKDYGVALYSFCNDDFDDDDFEEDNGFTICDQKMLQARDMLFNQGKIA